MAIFFLLPSKKFLPIPFKIRLLETSPPKTDVYFFWCLFPSCTFWIICNLLLLFTFCQVCRPVKETVEIEIGMAEKSSLDQANILQKLGLVWRNRKKSSQIIKAYFYLPFLLLVILWIQRNFYFSLLNSLGRKSYLPPPSRSKTLFSRLLGEKGEIQYIYRRHSCISWTGVGEKHVTN